MGYSSKMELPLLGSCNYVYLVWHDSEIYSFNVIAPQSS